MLLALFCSALAESGGFFEGPLHGFLLAHDLFPAAFHKAAQGGSVNPQYGKLMLYAAAWLALSALLLLVPRARSSGRALALLAASLCMTGSFAFHAVLVDDLLLAEQHARLVSLAGIAALPETEFREACAAGDFDCVSGPAGAPLAFPGAEEIGREIAGVHGHDPRSPVMRYAWSSAFSLTDPALRSFLIAYDRRGGTARAAVDLRGYAAAVDRHQLLVSALIIAIHTVWLGLAAVLAGLHRAWFPRHFRAAQA
jgi:hypothetical protein